jgi:hypothetical protein
MAEPLSIKSTSAWGFWLSSRATLGDHNVPSDEWSEWLKKLGKLSLKPAVNTVKYNTIQYNPYFKVPVVKLHNIVYIIVTYGFAGHQD